LAGEARVSGDVMLFDEVGDQSALVCAEAMALSGCAVTLVTPDRAIAHDLGPTNSSVLLRELVKLGVKFECFLDLDRIANDGNRKKVSLKHVLTGDSMDRIVDHIVVENGIKPIDEIYHALKQHSLNHGQLDHKAMIAGSDPFVEKNPDGQFNLARIGDAVASRNIHASIYDALRVCKNI